MSHTVVKVYSFRCDRRGCQATADAKPNPRDTPLLRAAERELIKQGWAVNYRGKQFCPAHSGDA